MAIVGARSATAEAVRATRRLAAELAASGWLVLSGGAVGIDAAAHRGALDAGAPTVAVLGCGVNVVYPAVHADLFNDIRAGGGGLLSPFGRGEPPRAGQFVRRNQVMAGLADAVVVMQAGARSGSLHTARAARGYGRVVGARPGTPGCERLIASGAAVIECAADVKAAMAGAPRRPAVQAPAAGTDDARVLAALAADRPRRVDELCAETGLDARRVTRALSGLELEGLVIGYAGPSYVRSALAGQRSSL